MKKNYTLAVLFFMLCGWMSAQTFGAKDDFAIAPYPTSGQVKIIENIIANDSIGNQQATLDLVTLDVGNSPTPLVSVEPDGSVWLVPTALTNPGTYVINYWICSIENPNLCGQAEITVVVTACTLPPATLTDVVAPYCNQNGALTLADLPVYSNFYMTRNGELLENINISMLPDQIEVFGLSPGDYTFTIITPNNCQTETVAIDFPETCGLTLDIDGTYQDYNNDGVVSPGDLIHYTFAIGNSTDAPFTQVYVSAMSNINPLTLTGNPIASLGVGTTNNTAYTGVHVITQQDINYGSVTIPAMVVGTQNNFLISAFNAHTHTFGLTTGFTLNAFIDTNGNGTQEAGELSFPEGYYNYEINNDGNVHQLTAWNSVTLYEQNPANTYTFWVGIHQGYTQYFTVSATYSGLTVGSGLTTLNFPVTVTPYVDLEVSLWQDNAPPRPGFTFRQLIFVKNNGNEAITSGSVIYTKDPAVTITSISHPNAVLTPNGFTVPITYIEGFGAMSVFVTMQTPTIPTVALGDQFNSSVVVTLPPNDVNHANNSDSLTQELVGSYDPNDKSENHGGKILHSEFTADDVLTYTIRFENTGTANAVFVHVNDVLDDKLDETTVRMITASHPFVLDRVNNNLTWKFDAIDLPPSVENTEIGHGYITFQVKPKAGYAIGDIIENKADIFFDFNPAIVTDPVFTEFVSALAVSEFETDAFAVYPNPTNGIVHISLKDSNIESVHVTDVLGKTIHTQNVSAKNAKVDLTPLSKGMYFVKVKSAHTDKTVKIIKN